MNTYEILQRWCRGIYYSGVGNYWIEDKYDDNAILFKLYHYVLFSLFVILTILEIVALLFGDLPQNERDDCMVFIICHVIILAKLFVVLANKRKIKLFLSDLIKACEKYEDETMLKRRHKVINITVTAYSLTIFGCMSSFIVQGIWKTFKGQNFNTVVTIYPTSDDYSTLACVFRVCTTLILFTLMVTMIYGADSFVLINLLILKYKFITLRYYFEALSQKLENDSSSNPELVCQKLNKDLIEGIEMHKELLRLTEILETTFTSIIGIQIAEAVGSAVTFLLQIMLLEKFTIVIFVKVLFFTGAVYLLLGLFLCNTGDITYQALLLPDAIYFSGWHLCQINLPVYNDTRRLVVLAIAQAQRPLAIRAFKMVDLTYSNFLQVLKATYSIVAVFYSQHE